MTLPGFDEQQREIRENFSLERRIPQPPLPSMRPRRMITLMRFIIWVSPAPMCLFACVGIGMALGAHDNPNLFLAFCLPAIVVVTLGCGYCDSFVVDSVPKKDGTPVLSKALYHALGFALMQLLVAPLTIFCFIAVALVIGEIAMLLGA